MIKLAKRDWRATIKTGIKMEIGSQFIERVKRQGMYQQITFTVAAEKVAVGTIKVLKSEKIIDLAEAVRLAERYNLPIHAGEMNIILPKGKMLNDFLIL